MRGSVFAKEEMCRCGWSIFWEIVPSVYSDGMQYKITKDIPGCVAKIPIASRNKNQGGI